MRPGGAINLAVRRGHSPQRRQRARALFRCSQSGSVISPAACMAMTPRISISTPVSQSPGFPRRASGNNTTFGILHSDGHAPANRERPCNVGNWTFRNSFYRSCHKCHVDERGQFRLPSEILHDSRRPLFSPPVGVVRGAGAVGVSSADRSRETCDDHGCRRAPHLGLAPEPRRRLRPLEPGRYAPAGCRDAVLDRQKDLRVRVPVHVRSPSRQAHS